MAETAPRRDTDLSWGMIRAYWPIIIALVLGVWAWGETRFTVKAHEGHIEKFNEILDRKSFQKWAIDKTNMQRNILELRKDHARLEKRLDNVEAAKP